VQTAHLTLLVTDNIQVHKDYMNAYHHHATMAMTTNCHHHHSKSATGHDNHPPPPPCNGAHNCPPHHSKPAMAMTTIHHHYPATTPMTAHQHLQNPQTQQAVWKPTHCVFLIFRVPEHKAVGFPPTVSFLHMYLQSP